MKKIPYEKIDTVNGSFNDIIILHLLVKQSLTNIYYGTWQTNPLQF